MIRYPLHAEQYVRQSGDILHPERESKETLDKIRQTLGEHNFSAQYQQSPRPVGGGMVKEEWFGTYEFAPEFDQVIQSWDTAIEDTDTMYHRVLPMEPKMQPQAAGGCRDKK